MKKPIKNKVMEVNLIKFIVFDVLSPTTAMLVMIIVECVKGNTTHFKRRTFQLSAGLLGQSELKKEQ